MGDGEIETLNEMGSSYWAVIKEDWKKLADEKKVLSPMTMGRDTALHLAVHSGEEEPTGTLLNTIKEDEIIETSENWKNAVGNTPLHVAAYVGNLAAVKLLVEYRNEDLYVQNALDETPLYRAAKFGHIDIVVYFLKDCKHHFSESSMSSNWFGGKNKTPLIHAAVQNQEFETVLKLIELIENSESLLEHKDSKNQTALHVLANMPHAFPSGSSMTFLESTIYKWVPSENIYELRCNSNDKSKSSSTKENSDIIEDLEAGDNPNSRRNFCYSNFCRYLFWTFIMQGWPKWKQMYSKKRQHELAMIITEKLAKIDNSWYQKHVLEETDYDQGDVQVQDEAKDDRTEKEDENKGKKEKKKKENEFDFVKLRDHQETPLLAAASNGIIEVVEKIVETHPQAVDYVTKKKRNILHVAILHRQERIFNWLRERRFIMGTLVQRIDSSGFTPLHQVGVTKYNRSGAHGPAMQLQQELQWYDRVKKEVPALHLMHHSKKKGTAQDFFNESHMGSLHSGKEWLKKTSESCSAVAVLVATVVFAAAYTVPGGVNDQTGTPILLYQPIFTIFTIMDIIALATSLSSVAIFLSILTSSFEMEDFLLSLPLKLSIGFQLLFFSVVSTMVAFALTIVLTMESAKLTWTIYFIYVATFFPIFIFIIIQMPLYVELIKNIWNYFPCIRTFLPIGFITSSWEPTHSRHVKMNKFA